MKVNFVWGARSVGLIINAGLKALWIRFQPGSPCCESKVIFRCVKGKVHIKTRSREPREYLECVEEIRLAPRARGSLTPGNRKRRQVAAARGGGRSVLDQESENDHEQDNEKKPPFHGGDCDISSRQVNSGRWSHSMIAKSIGAKTRRSGRGVQRPEPLESCAIKFDQ
jgi:hypothetical protein